MSTSTMQDRHRPRRFVNPEDLICPGCGEQVRCEPPGYWVVAHGPRPDFSHPDGSALCPASANGRPVEPIEITNDTARS